MHIWFAVPLNDGESFNNNNNSNNINIINNNNVVKAFLSHCSLRSLELLPLLPHGRVALGTIPSFPRGKSLPRSQTRCFPADSRKF